MNTVPQLLRAIPPETTALRIAPKNSSRQRLALLLSLLYVALAAVPLIFFTADSQSRGAGFWWDFGVGLGFGALGMIALQFVLTARFRIMTAPFGIDILYYFHRWAALASLTLILGHYAAFRTTDSDFSKGGASTFAPWPIIAGRAAFVTIVVLIFTSIFRKKIRFEYDKWRIVHSVLALAALLFTILHIEATGYTSPFVRIGVWAVAGLALLALAHIRIIRPWLLSKKAYSVLSVEPERGDSWTLTVKPERNNSLEFNPGQFAWLSLGSNPFRAKEHPFSFSGSAATKGTLRFTIKELGDFTRTIKNIQPATPAYVDGPYGSFSPDFHHASRYVFIAGGVGIAPIMSILRTLADRNDTRPLQLIYGNSTWERVLFREELDLLQSSLNLTVLHVLRDPPIDWSGAKGILTADLLKGALRDPAPQQDCVFFVCGPPGMIKTASRTLRKLGVPLQRIHFEHFEMA